MRKIKMTICCLTVSSDQHVDVLTATKLMLKLLEMGAKCVKKKSGYR